MSFKINKLAACIAMAAVIPASAINAQVTDIQTPYAAGQTAEQTQVIYVYLSDLGSLSKATIKNKQRLDNELLKIKSTQQRVIADIKAIDGNIEVISSTRLFGNFITIKADVSLAEKIKQVAGVKHISVETKPISMPVNAMASISSTAQNDAISIPPLSAEANAGSGVKVAIIGTGVDYTHKSLGGVGTPEAYADAMANATAPFDGFPTDVVVGGLDLSSENHGLDLNPIDQNIRCVRDYDKATHNTGFGTRLASAVHALAPGAKLTAYKTSNVAMPNPDTCRLSAENTDKFVQAIERAVDPKGDGSFEGRADIIVIDAYGNSGFYSSNDEGISAPIVETYAIEMASALGSLVVVNAGSFGDKFDSHYNLAWRAAAPSALTVGGMTKDAKGTLKVTKKTPYGPVRGSNHYTKPDMVSYAEQIDVAVVGTQDKVEKSSDTVMGAARIAAAAAIVKSKRPDLSMTEVKALLMNTANKQIQDLNGKQAELTLVGSGTENLADALTSPSVVWEKGTYQPSLNFGFQEGLSTQRFVKQVQIKNLSDKTVTYNVSVDNDGKDGKSALTWELPTSVSVPAGQTVVFPAVLNIDFTKLQNWPLNNTAGFTADNWAKIELTGHIQLKADGKPTLSMNWMAKPRSATKISRDFTTLESIHEVKGIEHPFGPFAGAYKQSFSNDSATDTTFAVFPLMFHADSKPKGKQRSRGNFFSDIGAGVYEEAQCTSGKKLAIATRFFAPNDAGIANHFDKIGPWLTSWTIFQEEYVVANKYNEKVVFPPNPSDDDTVMNGFVEPDENLQPVAWYIDLSMEFDRSKPRARYKKSKLPTYISAHGQNIVAQYCLEELYHGDKVNSVESFDKNHGWIFATDRDAQNDLGKPMIQFNPLKYGKTEAQGGPGGGIGLPGPGLPGPGLPGPGLPGPGLPGPAPEKNLGGLPLFSKAVQEGEAATYSNMITLGANETASLTAISDCALAGGLGPIVGCQNPGMLIMSLNDNWAMQSPMDTAGYSPIPSPKDGQQHRINEDAKIGDVVGNVELDSEGFFSHARFDAPSYPYQLTQVNGIAGEPFKVSAKGVITVNNPDAIDYDQGNKHFELEVLAKKGNTYSSTSKVYIDINPVNDIAPIIEKPFEAVTLDANENIEINAAKHITDAEGDTLMFKAEGLPDGISIDADTGMITGKTSSAGNHNVTITAEDGEHKVQAKLTITVNAQKAPQPPKKKSSGSLGFSLLALLGVFGATRRRSMLK
ncbi:S8 family serine peptidase [Parashewanella tropica]|uniref:S8 family serine peptidase n=1 Tax=Parashewanella tropica TaxID=2547970 RepID=UPI0010599A3A|nr:S8 family serine peptidase [Parashewanella tropica]